MRGARLGARVQGRTLAGWTGGAETTGAAGAETAPKSLSRLASGCCGCAGADDEADGEPPALTMRRGTLSPNSCSTGYPCGQTRRLEMPREMSFHA